PSRSRRPTNRTCRRSKRGRSAQDELRRRLGLKRSETHVQVVAGTTRGDRRAISRARARVRAGAVPRNRGGALLDARLQGDFLGGLLRLAVRGLPVGLRSAGDL